MIRNKTLWLSLLFTATMPLFFFLKAGVFLAAPAGAPQPADAIVILGGDGGDRTLRGLDLYRKRYAPVLLLTGVEGGEQSVQSYYLNWRAQILIAGGVKKDAIRYDAASVNSWQEAENTLKMAKASGWRKVIVVSDPPHMRRLKWVWTKVLRGTGVGFILVSERPSWWNARKWWGDEQSAKFVVSEYVKLPYYFFKY